MELVLIAIGFVPGMLAGLSLGVILTLALCDLVDE